MTAADMEQSGVKSLSEVAAVTPGVEFDNVSTFGPNLWNVAIRGVNSTAGASTTGIYIDDTPIQTRILPDSDIGQPLPLTFDLNRVEVDRGPQGTLFGSGAEGGTMRFISNEPGMNAWSGLVHSEIAATEYGGPSYETGVAGGGGLVPDVIGVRASAWYRHDGGYVDRVDPLDGSTVDADSNGSTSKSARVAVAIAPNDSLKLTTSVSYQSLAVHDTGTYYESLSDPNSGVFKNGRLLAQPFDDTFYLPSLKIEADLGFASLTSITSYFHRNAFALYDVTNELGALTGGFGNPLGPELPTSYADASPSPITKYQATATQEVRLASHDANARVTWVTGLFYSHAQQADTVNVTAPFLQAPEPVLYLDQGITDTQYAAFGQVDAKFLEHFRASVGVRVARVQYDAFQAAAGEFNAGVPPTSTGSASETPVTPKFGISYQADSDNLYYATIAKGYRVGGVNTPLPTYCGNVSIPASYSSDDVWSYEIGAKNSLLDGRFQLDSSVFHINWQKIQQMVTVASCGFDYFANTGSAISNGFDIAASALLTTHVKAGLSLGYTDAYFTKTVVSDGVVIVDKGDAVGTVPQVPSPWNVTASTEYTAALVNGAVLTLRAEDVFHSRNPGPFASYDPRSISYAPAIPPNPSTNAVQLRMSVAYSSLDLAFFVNNALNAHPVLMRSQETPATTSFYNTTFRPRTAGLSATWRF